MKKLFILALFLGEMRVCSAQVFQSSDFSVVKLGDGIYAAIAKNGGYAVCNAGIIDLGGATLVFDPFMVPQPAEALKKLAHDLTGNPVKYVVNSHYHNDHIGGDQVFSGASLISTEKTRELIAKSQPEEISEDKKSVPAQLEKMKSWSAAGKSLHEQEEHRIWLGYLEALSKFTDSLVVLLPDVTFKDQLIIHGTKRTALLITNGKGHTESDLFLYLPDDHIAFLGDLLFAGFQPYLGDGDSDLWTRYLDSIAKLNIKTFVPGHGPVATQANIDSMKLYFHSVNETAKAYYKKGMLPEKDSTLKSPAPFDKWFLFNFYKPNVISEYSRLYKK